MQPQRRINPPRRLPPPVREVPAAISERRAVPADSCVPRPTIDEFGGSLANLPLTDPYLDYGRFLTPEGGVLIVYKDLDLRWRHTLWRLLARSVATGGTGWHLYRASPVHGVWLDVVCGIAIMLVNWLIVREPVEIYRRIEVRPDCLILEGTDIFWRERMEGGLPTLQPDEDGTMILCGVYGTRFVEYGTLRRFDEFDRMPETFAAHLAEAVEQLWAPSKTAV